jgi:hypothetical protein
MRDQYRELAVEWDKARDNPPEAHRLFDALLALYKELRDSAAGRQAIASLLDDPITAVGLAAATHGLAWQPAKAEQVLGEIEREGSINSVTANGRCAPIAAAG